MLLTIDLGNTSLKLGVYDDNEQEITFGCFDSKQSNYRSLVMSFLYKAGLREDSINSAIFSCVVPSLHDDIFNAVNSIVPNIYDVSPYRDYGITLDVPSPDTVGDDIIVMCAYAYNLYHRELMVVSMGTCTVLCHVTKEGKFKHCIIAPGFIKTAETLWKNADQLREMQIEKPSSYLANTTEDAVNVGIYNGYLGLLDNLIGGMINEIDETPYVIGCGGVGKLLVPYSNRFNEYEPDFVSKGLCYLYKRFYK